jgi:hemerythrin-like domain-containing protein
MDLVRRQWLAGICSVGAGVVLLGCDPGKNPEEEASEKAGKESAGTEVGAIEDLMREHGVLRRALLVFQESAVKLRANAAAISPEALQKTAKLFRTFGEEYHEKKLEETHIFPAVKNISGLSAAYVGVLTSQHERGREITEYILAVTGAAKLASANVEPLARAMEALGRMYQHHAAIEDTMVFPAWKQTMTKDQIDEIGDQFEKIEQQQFGKDGYEDAVRQIGEIETSLGLADLGQFTAPAPPALPETKPPDKAEPEKSKAQ